MRGRALLVIVACIVGAVARERLGQLAKKANMQPD